jgi:hypothetical protein
MTASPALWSGLFVDGLKHTTIRGAAFARSLLHIRSHWSAGNKRRLMHAINARVSTATCLKTPYVQNSRAKVGARVVQQGSPDTRRLIDVDQQRRKVSAFPASSGTEFKFNRFKSPAQMSAIAIHFFFGFCLFNVSR